MILYHFTSFGHLPLILTHGGLEKGDVPVGIHGEQSLNATWLTTDPNPHNGHGLATGGLAEIPTEIAEATGGGRWRLTVDKRVVRISLRIPSNDRKLKHWILWTQGRLGEKMLEIYTGFGGSKAAVDSWYIYNGLIPRSAFTRIDLMRDDERGVFMEATEEQISCLEPHTTGASFGVRPAPYEH